MAEEEALAAALKTAERYKGYPWSSSEYLQWKVGRQQELAAQYGQEFADRFVREADALPGRRMNPHSGD